jgi:hypothetical protein
VDEDDAIAIENNADEAAEILSVALTGVLYVVLDLLEGMPVGRGRIAVLQGARRLIFDNDAAIDRVGATSADKPLVRFIEIEVGILREALEEWVDVEAQLGLVVSGTTRGADLGREPLGILLDLPV